jgi:hypothetical protein
LVRAHARSPLLPRCSEGEDLAVGSRRYPVDSDALLVRFAGMKRMRKSEPAAPAVRTWRVSVIRKRLERLGRVTGPDQQAAEAAALAEFHLKDHEAKRLLVEEVQ